MEKEKLGWEPTNVSTADFDGCFSKEREERLKAMLKGKDISEVVNLMLNTRNSYNRRILRFFRWFCKWMPIAIMLIHWYGLYDFSQHPRDMFLLDSENTSCYLWIYFMAYVSVVPLYIQRSLTYWNTANIKNTKFFSKYIQYLRKNIYPCIMKKPLLPTRADSKSGAPTNRILNHECKGTKNL